MVVRNGRHFTLPQEQRGQQRLTSLLQACLSAPGVVWQTRHQLERSILKTAYGEVLPISWLVGWLALSSQKWPNHILNYVQNQPWYSFNSLLLCRRGGVAPEIFGVFCPNLCVNLFSCVSRHGRREEFCSEHFTSFRIVVFIRYVVCVSFFAFVPFLLFLSLFLSLFQAKCLILS